MAAIWQNYLAALSDDTPLNDRREKKLRSINKEAS